MLVNQIASSKTELGMGVVGSNDLFGAFYANKTLLGLRLSFAYCIHLTYGAYWSLQLPLHNAPK